MDLIKLSLSVTNCYLFRNGKGWVLVDTGYEEDWQLFRRRLAFVGLQIAQISHLILTHHHDDHVGFVGELVAENPAIAAAMSESTRELLLVGKNDQSYGGGLINRRVESLIGLKQLYVSLRTGKHQRKENNLHFRPYTARRDDIVFSGEPRLHDLGIELEGRILATPGHTVDSVSILFDDGDCMVGDAAANMLRLAGTHNCVIFVTDLEQYYASWRKLIAAGAKRILPAHGRSFPVERLAHNVGRNRPENMRRIVAASALTHSTTSGEVTGVDIVNSQEASK